MGVPASARYLYVVGLCYSSNNLSDGHLGASIIPLLHAQAGTTDTDIAALVEAGLWLEFDDGYGIDNYGKHQQTKADVEAKRKADAARQQKARDRKRAESHGVTQEESRRDEGVSHNGRKKASRSQIRSDEIRSEPPLSRQDALAEAQLSTVDVWAQALEAGIPKNVIERARSDYGAATPSAGALADHIATRYTPPKAKSDLDDHYRRHGNPSEATHPLRALAHRAGWTRTHTAA